MDESAIEDEALRLPAARRAWLADRLIQSLSPAPSNLQAEWLHELESRMAALHAGTIDLLDGPQAMADLRSRFLP
jgi:putative addiction module component (TIGR02574 family)